MKNKILAIAGIIVSLLVIGFVIFWFTSGKGMYKVWRFSKKNAVSEEKTLPALTPEEKKELVLTPEEIKKEVRKRDQWQRTLSEGKPAKATYDTKGLYRLIRKDMISNAVKHDSFKMVVKDGRIHGQASIVNPLDTSTWLNIKSFDVTITIRDFHIDMAFNELIAVKEGTQDALDEAGLNAVRNFIKNKLQESLDGKETAGTASDLYFIKDLEIKGDEIHVTYDPTRYKYWVEARQRYRNLQRQGHKPSGVPKGGNGTAEPAPPTEKPENDVF